MSRDETAAEQEWNAQELALRQERAGAPAGGDPRDAQYRIIARVLLEPPFDTLPDGFAAAVAARAERRPRLGDDVVEVWLPRVLVGVLALAGVGTAAAYGADAWRRAGRSDCAGGRSRCTGAGCRLDRCDWCVRRAVRADRARAAPRDLSRQTRTLQAAACRASSAVLQ